MNHKDEELPVPFWDSIESYKEVKMRHNGLMCNDPENAQLNRERIARGETDQFYEQQAHAVAQWLPGEPKPESVVLGELPYVGMKQIRLDTD